MISVVVPSYNSERYIEDCLTNLLNQTYYDIEIIVVDDESCDHSEILLKSIEKKDKRIQFHVIKHGGPGVARNYGIKKAIGEYIFFCDADDIVPVKSLELLYNKIKSDNTDITIGNYKISYGDGTYEIFRTPSIQKSRFNSFFESVTVWNRIYRTSFLKNNNIWFPDIFQGEDRLFLANLYLKNPKISLLNKIVYIWQRHVKDKDKTLSQKEDIGCLVSQVSCMREFRKIMKNSNSEDLIEHIKYNCGYLLDIYLRINKEKDRHEAYKVLNEYINSIEWEKEDQIFKEIFDQNPCEFKINKELNNE